MPSTGVRHPRWEIDEKARACRRPDWRWRLAGCRARPTAETARPGPAPTGGAAEAAFPRTVEHAIGGRPRSRSGPSGSSSSTRSAQDTVLRPGRRRRSARSTPRRCRRRLPQLPGRRVLRRRGHDGGRHDRRAERWRRSPRCEPDLILLQQGLRTRTVYAAAVAASRRRCLRRERVGRRCGSEQTSQLAAEALGHGGGEQPIARWRTYERAAADAGRVARRTRPGRRSARCASCAGTIRFYQPASFIGTVLAGTSACTRSSCRPVEVPTFAEHF